MLQEIIVYIILIFILFHLLLKSIAFFKPSNKKNCGTSCASGSCSGCSLKVDIDFLQTMNQSQKKIKNLN